jgi:hypothetical protein
LWPYCDITSRHAWVRFVGQTGKHLLSLSLTACDPHRTRGSLGLANSGLGILRLGAALFGLNVRLANDAAVLVILLANKGAEIRAAGYGWKHAAGGKLSFGFGVL